MGMNMNFVAISLNVQQLEDLKEYIEELYVRPVCNGYHMYGSAMQIVPVDDVFVLCGCHRNCFGYALGFWCNTENKNSLLQDVIYLEDRESDEEILQYFPDKGTNVCGLLGRVEVFMNPHRNEIPITGVNMSEKLLQVVLYWFEHNEVPKCL